MKLEQYRSLYQKIEVPQQLSEKVLQSAEQPISVLKTAPVRWKKTALRVSAVCCAFALVAGGIVINGSRRAVATPPVKTSQNGAAVAKSQNSFDLAVYAAEASKNKTNTPIDVRLKNFGLEVTGIGPITDEKGNYNPAMIGFAALTKKLKGVVSYPLELSCTGKNIRTVHYEIKNGDARFANWPYNMAEQYNSDGTLNTKEIYTTSFTVDYAKQSNAANELTRDLEVRSPLSLDTLNKMMDADRHFDEKLKTSKKGDTLLADSEEERYQIEKEAVADNAKALGECRLVLTATFKDGSAQTKTYQIKPSAKYAELRQKIHDKQTQLKKKYQKEEESAEKDEKIRKECEDYANSLESLFTITQVYN